MKLPLTRSSALMALALAAIVATTAAAHAAGIPIAITPTGGNSYQINNCPANVCNLSGWDNAGYQNHGYNFVLDTATSAVNTGPQNGLKMDGSTVTNGASVLALDADYQQGAVTTDLSGLAAGDVVTVKFDFAGDQQLHGSDGCGGCTGNFDALLAVTLGGAAPTAGGALLDAAAGSTLGSPDITN